MSATTAPADRNRVSFIAAYSLLFEAKLKMNPTESRLSRPSGLVGTLTFWAVFLPSIVSPFGVYLSRVFAEASVPDELLEAGRLDGAGEVRTFFTVSIRLMFPALVTVFLFQFVAIWNNFFLPLIMLRSEELFPVTFGLYAWNSSINQFPELRGYVLVGALISIIPLIVTFLLLQRYWRTGLGTGALK